MPRAEGRDHVGVGGPAGSHHLVGHRVQVEGVEAGGGESREDLRLPAGDAPGEPDAQGRGHQRTRPAQAAADAAFTVFFMSRAMVRGPTPPGTGVIAEATSRTATKSTSPTRA